MNVKTVNLSITDTDADTAMIFVPEGDESNNLQGLNPALKALLDDLIQGGDFSGKAEEIAVLYPRGIMEARRLIFVGIGTVNEVTIDILRRTTAVGVQKARALSAQRAAFALPDLPEVGLPMVAQAIAEGTRMGLYKYDGQKTGDKSDSRLTGVEILVTDPDQVALVQQGVTRGEAYAQGSILARDLVNLPPNICTPEYLAQRALEVGEAYGLKVDVLGQKQMRTLKMGAILAVAQGSDTPPRFIIMEHNTAHAEAMPTVVLIGKGVTFDTGGYSMKSVEGMIGMKADMGGGAAVIGAMLTIAALKLPLHVVGLVPAADNMVSGHAYRPQEVITASNGKSIEIISTDAEGRLLLADALVYARRFNPSAVVDIATLTGACVVALGKAAAGLFYTADSLRDVLMAAGNLTGERVWPLPLYPEYDKAIESQTADIKNSGGRTGGVGTSAMFLKHFVDYPAWAHIDMAGVMLDAEGDPCIPEQGATGFGARLLAQFTEMWSDEQRAEEKGQ